MEEVELKEAAINLARHIHESKFDGIIISGGSSSLSKALLYSAWRKEFPEEKVPKTITIPSEGNQILYKRTEPEDPIERQAVSTDWIDKNMPELWELKDKKVCLLDDIAVSGDKVRNLSELFHNLGFKQFETALFGASRNAELTESTFVGSQNFELVSRLYTATSRIQGNVHIDDSELPEDSEKEIRNRGLNDLRGMVGEIRK